MKILKRRAKFNIERDWILQILVMAGLFLFVFDKEVVLTARDVLNRLSIDTDVTSFFCRVFWAFRTMLDTPTIYALMFMLIQFICLAGFVVLCKNHINPPYYYVKDDVNFPEVIVRDNFLGNNDKYLEISRLLF